MLLEFNIHEKMSEIEYIEQHNVGFGSCLVIGHYSNSMLMVDCGSMNNKVNNTPFKSIVYNISERYQDVSQRDFCLHTIIVIIYAVSFI